MGRTRSDGSVKPRTDGAGDQMDHLEELAEELIKENPEEAVVKAHMKAAGLRYTEDSAERLTVVLNSLEKERSIRPHGKDL